MTEVFTDFCAIGCPWLPSRLHTQTRAGTHTQTRNFTPPTLLTPKPNGWLPLPTSRSLPEETIQQNCQHCQGERRTPALATQPVSGGGCGGGVAAWQCRSRSVTPQTGLYPMWSSDIRAAPFSTTQAWQHRSAVPNHSHHGQKGHSSLGMKPHQKFSEVQGPPPPPRLNVPLSSRSRCHFTGRQFPGMGQS